MKIAIVSGAQTVTETIRQLLLPIPGYQVVWTARDGAEAVTKCAIDRPDLVVMDLLMPIMDGAEATQHIMQQSPCAILLLTSNLQHHTTKVFQALGDGAIDAVSLPTSDQPALAQPLLHKIASIRTLLGKQPSTSPSPCASRRSAVPLLVIGASTGGPKALATLLTGLPADFSAAIVVVQHVDAEFAPGMVEWLQHHTPLPIALAQPGDRPQPGTVFLAGTNDHLILQPDFSLGYVREPLDNPYRPSVDVFFRSVARLWESPGTAVLLTGMGRDGAAGLLALRQKGWQTIAQNQATCVVYGMPKAAVELGAATTVLPLEAIAPTLLKSTR